MFVLALLLVAGQLLGELWEPLLPAAWHKDVLTYPGTGSQNAGFLITSLCHSLDHALSVAPLLEQSLNVAREAAAPRCCYRTSPH